MTAIIWNGSYHRTREWVDFQSGVITMGLILVIKRRTYNSQIRMHP